MLLIGSENFKLIASSQAKSCCDVISIKCERKQNRDSHGKFCISEKRQEEHFSAAPLKEGNGMDFRRASQFLGLKHESTNCGVN